MSGDLWVRIGPGALWHQTAWLPGRHVLARPACLAVPVVALERWMGDAPPPAVERCRACMPPASSMQVRAILRLAERLGEAQR